MGLVFFTLFIDMLGIGLVIPTLAPLFLTSSDIFTSSETAQARTLWYGLMLATYTLATFFGAPIIGAWSDRVGRKRALLLSIAGGFVGYLIFIVGLQTSSLPFLILGRLVSGLAAGNITVCFAAVADISTPEQKARSFGFLGISFGLGVIIGPWLGGILADDAVVSWFSSQVPFWLAAGLCLVNGIFVQLYLIETLTAAKKKPLTLLTGLKNIRRAFGNSSLRGLFLLLLLYVLGFGFFTQFFAVFAIRKFGIGNKELGNIFGFIGLWIIITQGFIMRALTKRLKGEQILFYSLPLFTIGLACTLLPPSYPWIFATIPLVAIGQGLTFPTLQALISNRAAPEIQGEILGINQSLQNLGFAIAQVLGAYISGINYHSTTVAAVLCAGVGFLLYLGFNKQLLTTQKV